MDENKRHNESIVKGIKLAAFGLALLASSLSAILDHLTISAVVLQCRDEDNRPVDWFVIYKIPIFPKHKSNGSSANEGISYYYVTSNTVEKGWTRSKEGVDSQNSIPGLTLAPLYDDDISSRLMWVLYNDDTPEPYDFSGYGHTKGVLMANKEEGFWLIHNVPKFPPIPKKGDLNSVLYRRNKRFIPDKIIRNYGYPKNGERHGQSFMCISVKAEQVDKIARQLMYNEIVIYRKNDPESLALKYNVFAEALKGKKITRGPWENKETISSSSGMNFTSFAKSHKWEKDLYADFVVPHLNSDLLVRTWRSEIEPAKVGDRWILNVNFVQFPGEEAFEYNKDHSKWAISRIGGRFSADGSYGADRSWICVGDINREKTQNDRGGGTVCLQSLDLWEAYESLIVEVERMPGRSTCTACNQYAIIEEDFWVEDKSKF